MSIEERVKVRLPEIEDGLLTEFTTTATDRIKIRLGVTEYPEELESIAVEVICAMYNRRYHEGLKSENVDTFRMDFVDDILKQYEKEFQTYLDAKEKEENKNRGVVRFL
jgi:hypothetical protein